LHIGLQTDQQYGRIRQTIRGLSDEYRIMGRDSEAAMHTLAYATGEALTGIGALARTGTAYGIGLSPMARIAAARALTGVTGTNIGSLLAVYHQAAPGVLPMGAQRAVEQMVQIGQIGGLSTAPMSDLQIARTAEQMGLAGGKFAANPAAAAERYITGMNAEASPLGEAARALGIQQRLRTNPQFTYGGRTYDLRTHMGQAVFRAHAGEIGAAQDAYSYGARQLAGGNPDILPLVLGEAMNEPDPWVAQQNLERDERVRRQYGSTERMMRTPAPLPEQARREAARLGGRYVPGQAVVERETMPGQVAETGIVAALEVAKNAITAAEQLAADALRTHSDAVNEVTGTYRELDKAARTLVNTFNTWAGLTGLTGGTPSALPGEGPLNPVPAPGPGGWMPGEYPPPPGSERRQPRKSP
jgi:hypothetical protein